MAAPPLTKHIACLNITTSAKFLASQTLRSRPRIQLPRSLPTARRYPQQFRLSSTSSSAMADQFLAPIKARRTYYQLSNTSPISDARIHELVNFAVKHVPSSFNSQSTRVVVLLGPEHEKLWDFAAEAVKAVAPAEAWPTSEKKLKGFRGGYGTVSRWLLHQIMGACDYGNIRN